MYALLPVLGSMVCFVLERRDLEKGKREKIVLVVTSLVLGGGGGLSDFYGCVYIFEPTESGGNDP